MAEIYGSNYSVHWVDMKRSLLSIYAVGLVMLAAGCTHRGLPDFSRERAIANEAMRDIQPQQQSIVYQPEAVQPRGIIPGEAPVLKVGILLPLSGDASTVGQAMLDAATMALSDSYLTVPADQIKAQVVLIPKDTKNRPLDASKAAQMAMDQGAGFMIGPLFSQSVTTSAPALRSRGINMLTFSNNRAVAGKGVYLFGLMPEEQVTRISEFAYLNNYTRVAILAPNDSYGEKVKSTLVDTYSRKGGVVAPAELYAPSPANIDAAVARLSQSYLNTPEDRRFQAIFIADGGNQLKNILISLRRSKIDLKKVKLMSTGLWDNPELLNTPELQGAWFPSTPPNTYHVFEQRFMATYGYKPMRLASLAYDAVTLICTIAMADEKGQISPASLTTPGGYISPANGLFRLREDGTSQRRLAILEIDNGRYNVIDPAQRNF